jgi:hypothetical protein
VKHPIPRRVKLCWRARLLKNEEEGTILNRMGKNSVRQILAALLVVLLAASPLAAAVCTMSCSDGGGPCCCENPGGFGATRYSAESCCGAEARSPAAANITAELLTHSSQTSPLFAATLDSSLETGDSADFARSYATPAGGQARGRSSPLFLLNVSFLI